MAPSPTLRSGPIELRLITPKSAQQLYELAREPELSTMLTWPPHQSVDDSLEFIHDTKRLWDSGSAWLAGIFERETGRLVGSTGLSEIDRHNRRAEGGTWIGIPYQGRGWNRYAKAALRAFAFDVLELNRLEFLVRTDNERSIGALRTLPGIQEEGVLHQRLWKDDVAHDVVLFALLANRDDDAKWPAVEFANRAAR